MQTKLRALSRASIYFLRLFTPIAAVAVAAAAQAQVTTDLDSVARKAISDNSAVRAAEARVEEARRRVSASATWPDPMLMLGVVNVTLGSERSAAHGTPTGSDPMRMNMIGVGQTVPIPGKLRLARRIAEADVQAADAQLAAVRREIERRVAQAYYDVAFRTRALAIVERNAAVLSSLISASEARYASAGGSQVEVLNARVEATRLGETAAELIESRRAATARLNALLERGSDTPVSADFSRELIVAAAPVSSTSATFVSAALGARAAGSPVKTVEELQGLARDSSATLTRHRALVETERARAALAAREHLPDLSASLEYGQRSDLPDMVSARLSLPLPIFKRRKQDALAAAARASVMAAEADLAAAEYELLGRIAELHANLERQRTQLALYVGALIPQAQATVQASLAGFQSGRTSLFEVLGHQASLFRYETEYFRALADFAQRLAELEEIVGAEVLR